MTLTQEKLAVKIACIDALCHLLTNMSSNYTGPFTALISPIANTIAETLKLDDEDKLRCLLEGLTSVADNEPKYFSKEFDKLFVVALQVAAKGCTSESEEFDDDKIPQMAIEMIISIIERIPSLLNKKPPADYVIPLFQVILNLMRQIPSEVDEEWLKPKAESFFEGEEEEDTLNFGKKAVDRVLTCLKGKEEGLVFLGPLLMSYFGNESDWRYKHAALLAASNVGEYVEEPKTLSVLVPIVVQLVGHSHPRVRFAAIHCIGQIVEDSDEDFSEEYNEIIMTALMAAFDDPIARVQRHACAATCNFVDKMSKETIDKYVTVLMQKMEKIIKTGEPIVQEYVMSVIASIAEATPENFKKMYYDQTMPFLVGVLMQCKEYKYKKLRGHTIECITIVARAVGKEKFKVHMKQVIETLYHIQEFELESQDPQKSFLLSAWQRLCLILKKDLVPYIELLIPSLLKLAASVPGISISGAKHGPVDLEKAARELMETTVPSKEEKSKMIHVTTTDIEEKEAAINMLGVLIDELSEFLDRYVESFSKIVLHVITRSGVETLRQAAAMSLKGLVKAAKNGKNVAATPEYIANLVRTFLEALVKSALDEEEPDPLCVEVIAMKDVLEEGGKCLDTPALQKIFEICVKLIEASNKRKIANSDLKESENADEADVEFTHEEEEKENELQLEIAQLMGCLFKFHPNEAFCFVNLLYPVMLSDMLKPESSKQDKQFALFLIIDMTEHLGYSRIPTLYPTFCDYILNFSQSNESGIRQACLYGIGAIAKNGGEYFLKIAEKCYQALSQAIECPMSGNANKKKWKAAKDNGISSLGKLIKLHGKSSASVANLIKYWLQYLPLKVDFEEGLIQNEMLADMILTDSVAALGVNGENLEQILKIFVSVIESEQVNEQISLKISKALNFLASIPQVKDKIGEIGKAFSLEEKEKLEKCIKLMYESH